VIVLSMEEMKNCFSRLLICLAIFDTIFIILVTLDYTLARGPILQLFTNIPQEGFQSTLQ
jgi:uncharacterized membrane protein